MVGSHGYQRFNQDMISTIRYSPCVTSITPRRKQLDFDMNDLSIESSRFWYSTSQPEVGRFVYKIILTPNDTTHRTNGISTI